MNILNIKPVQLKLRCYVKETANHTWYAMCIDLNLFAEANTAKEAENKLHSMIREYVKEALTEDSEYIRHLIPRRAPLYFLMQYYWLVLKYSINFVKSATSYFFIDHLPLIPYGR